jgi:hypothetical protein
VINYVVNIAWKENVSGEMPPVMLLSDKKKGKFLVL